MRLIKCMIYYIWIKVLEVNNVLILKFIDESVVINEEVVVNVLFLVELLVFNDILFFGFLIMFKYIGIIGIEIEKSRFFINNIVVIKMFVMYICIFNIVMIMIFDICI